MPPSHRAGRALLAAAIVAVFAVAVLVVVVNGWDERVWRLIRP